MKIKDMRTGEWGKIRAFFTIVTSEGFEIKGCKLVDGQNGVFVSAPQEKNKKNDEYYDTVWIPKEVRPELEKLASQEYSPHNQVESGNVEQASLTETNDGDVPF